MSRKALFVLNVHDYAREITDITYPHIRFYADKIGAEFIVIKERKFPAWPIPCEKLQIYELAKSIGAEWNIYFDSDTLIHPEMPDWTVHIPKDTVAHNSHDFAGVRYRYDEYFLRDGRNIASCGWMTFGSEWCLDLWKPCEDLTPKQAIERCFLTVDEKNSEVMDAGHLVDDFVMSRNIARFGLKHVHIMDIQNKLFPQGADFLFHAYTISTDEKVTALKETLDRWQMLPDHRRSFCGRGSSPMEVTGAKRDI